MPTGLSIKLKLTLLVCFLLVIAAINGLLGLYGMKSAVGGLETVYDQVATAIDAVGQDKSELFLVKLALLAAQQLGDEQVFADLIRRAQQDL